MLSELRHALNQEAELIKSQTLANRFLEKLARVDLSRAAVVSTALVVSLAFVNADAKEYNTNRLSFECSTSLQAYLAKGDIKSTSLIAVSAPSADFSFIIEGDSVPAMAKSLSDNGYGFMAIATTVEGFKNKPYFDVGGLNVGMGYCITKRIEALGSDKVKADLLSAGFNRDDVEVLLSNNRANIKKVVVTNKNAVLLLHQVSPEYEKIAEQNIGSEVFAGLSKRERDVWTYFAWNTGEHMAQFKRLIRGIQAGDSKKILPNMAPSFKGSDGEMVKNTRLETVLKVALVEGSDGLANGLNFDEVSAAKKVNSSLKHMAKDVQIFTKVAVASIENQDFNYAPS